MAHWTPCPFAAEHPHDTASVTRLWSRLHAGDAEPLPHDAAVMDAWVLYHRGEFQRAAEAGVMLGDAGFAVAHKATAVYAVYLEPSASKRLALLSALAERAAVQVGRSPECAAAHYALANALGHQTQSISVPKALAQGLGDQIKQALERTLALQPLHADAHTALGGFHADVIDKVGPLIARMTYGACQEVARQAFSRALALYPESVTGLIECARGLVMLQADDAAAESIRLYQRAAAIQPLDAREQMDVELAKQELELV